MTDVARWLAELGLAEYEAAFHAQDVDASVLPDLTEDDLRLLGVASLGHRKRLLRAIAQLRAPAAGASSTAHDDAAASADDEARSAERRLVSVLFCDLVDSTALSTRLDAEDLRELVGRFQRTVADVVERFDGFAAQFMGDGVMAWFGYPTAHEDDAERAIRAGLGAVSAVAGLATGHGHGLEARVGIASGRVVVGALGAGGGVQANAAIGDTPNLAARLQTVATPGSVAIAESTKRLAGGVFVYEDLGARPLRGFAQAMQAWKVLGPSGAEGRFDARHPQAPGPMHGRDDELALLLDRWTRSRAGEGQVVVVRAEPGAGKSRLVAALREHLPGAWQRFAYFCSPHHRDTPLQPFAAQLARVAGIAENDDARARFAKLELALRGTDPADRALLIDLLGLAQGAAGRRAVLQASPQARRARTLRAILRGLQRHARAQPLLVVFEDAHWADRTSLELLEQLVALVATMPAMLVITTRSEPAVAWERRPHVCTIELRRLISDDCERIVAGIAGARVLDHRTTREIVERADGIPLFVEELTRAVIDARHAGSADTVPRRATPDSTVPATLVASLVARLDLQPSAKPIAQAGAAIGREFGVELLESVVQSAPGALDDALGRLVGASLLSVTGRGRARRYAFRHALMQEAAYDTLLRVHRQSLHARIVQAIDERFPALAQSQPEVLARHLAQAGDAGRAIDAYRRASERALSRSAGAEALAHAEHALALVPTLAHDATRDGIEFAVQALLGAARSVTHGYGTDGALEAYERARSLARTVVTREGMEMVLGGLHIGYWTRAEYARAHEIALESLAAAQASGGPLALSSAHRLIAATSNQMGRYAAAEHHARLALGSYDAAHAGRAAAMIHDVAASAKCQLAIALWHRGRLDASRALDDDAIAQGRAMGHPNTVAVTSVFGGVASWRRGDVSTLSLLAGRLLRHGRTYAMPTWLAFGMALRGRALIERGRVGQGLAVLDRAIELAGTVTARAFGPTWRAFVAEGHLARNRPREALAAIDDAIELAEATGECCLVPELWRMRALALGRDAPSDACEAALRNALRAAREHGSLMFEWRAVRALVEVLAAQSGSREAAAETSIVLEHAQALGADAAVIAAVLECAEAAAGG